MREDHKTIEQLLRENETLKRELAEARRDQQTLKALMDYAPEGITIADADGTIRMVSRFGREVLGRSEQELKSKPIGRHADKWHIFHPDGITPAKGHELPLARALSSGEIVANEEWVLYASDGTKITTLCNAGPIRSEDGSTTGGVIVWRDIPERKEAEARIRYKSSVSNGINRILTEALTSDEEDLGRRCLEVAEEVTGSKFGFIGELKPGGVLDNIAISDSGWTLCRMDEKTGHRKVPTGFKVDGIYGRVLLDRKGFFTNAPGSHPDSIGLPEGHPPLKAFLGAPLVHKGRTVGMVGLGNRDGGYRTEDREALETLTIAIVQAFIRARAAKKLRESESKYRELVQNANSAIIRWKSDGTITFFNEYAEAFFGYRADEIIGRHVSILVPETESTGADLTTLVRDIVYRPENYVANINENICQDGRSVWMAWTNRPITDEHGDVTDYIAEYRAVLPTDGSIRWINARGRALYDEQGRPLKLLGIAVNVTERREMEDALREVQEKFRLAMRSPGVGTYWWDAVSGKVSWDGHPHPLFGKDSGTLTGSFEDTFAAVHPEDREKVSGEYASILQGGTVESEQEYRAVWPDGSVHFLQDRSIVYRDDQGQVLWMAGVCWDIT